MPSSGRRNVEKGRAFEEVCKTVISKVFRPPDWEIKRERATAYGKRIDVYARKKGLKGKRLAFECKDHPANGLKRGDINQAREYRRSGAEPILLVSSRTRVGEGVRDYADEQRVLVLCVNTEGWRLADDIRNVVRMLWHLRL